MKTPPGFFVVTWSIGVFFSVCACQAPAQDPTSSTASPSTSESGELLAPIVWDRGPTVARILAPQSASSGGQDAKGKAAAIAQLPLPSGFKFTGAEGAKAFLASIGSPPTPNTVGLLVPLGLTPSWAVAFTFEEVGRVRTDDKEMIDADRLLANIKAGLGRLNAARRSAKAPEIADLEWIEKPKYDEARRSLTWAIRGVVPADKGTANYDVRFLGRHGVMKATVMTSDDKYDALVSQVRPILEGFEFTPENRYSDWKDGEKIATSGLTDLVGGGSAAHRGLIGFLKSDRGLLLLAIGGGGLVFVGVMIGVGLSLSRKMKTARRP